MSHKTSVICFVRAFRWDSFDEEEGVKLVDERADVLAFGMLEKERSYRRAQAAVSS